MKIALVSGRTLVRSDNEAQALDVAMVDAKFATKVFGKENPLGARSSSIISTNRPSRWSGFP